MNQHTPEQIEQAKEDTVFLSDIMMRMLAGRDIAVCFNTVATVLNSIAHELPEEGRKFLVACTTQLATDIDAIETDVIQKEPLR